MSIAGMRETRPRRPASLPPIGVTGLVIALGLAAASTAVAACGPNRVRPAYLACDPADLRAAAGRSGAAAGTSYLDLTVSLAAGDACLVDAWPSVEVVNGSGEAVDASEPVEGGEIWLLETQLAFHLGWASWCDDYPAGPLTARLDFVASGSTDLALPDGFGPSLCNGSDSVLVVEPTSNQVLEPAR
jgi:hypothetical protein